MSCALALCYKNLILYHTFPEYIDSLFDAKTERECELREKGFNAPSPSLKTFETYQDCKRIAPASLQTEMCPQCSLGRNTVAATSLSWVDISTYIDLLVGPKNMQEGAFTRIDAPPPPPIGCSVSITLVLNGKIVATSGCCFSCLPKSFGLL